MTASFDWLGWYGAYDNPDSALSRRLAIVRRHIAHAVDTAGHEPVRILSLCSGDGRDLLPELALRPQLRASALLVELNPTLAERAGEAASHLTGVEVRNGDAGSWDTFADALPVDLLLLCGIFGNISKDDIAATIAATPAMLEPGASVIWTRGWFETGDLRPFVRQCFTDAGFTEVAFDQEPRAFGVGVARADQPLTPPSPPPRLFTFIRTA